MHNTELLTHIHNSEDMYWSEIIEVTHQAQFLPLGTHIITINNESYTITNEPT